jgi:hypothetical protein
VIRSAKEAIRILSDSRWSRIARAPDFVAADHIARSGADFTLWNVC